MRMLAVSTFAIALTCCVNAGNGTSTPNVTGATSAVRAEALAKKIIIVDGHVDLPYRLEDSKAEDGALTEDPAHHTEKGDFDYERAKAGGLNAPFMSIYIPAKHQKDGGGRALADALIDMVEDLVKKSPGKFAIARSPSEIREQHSRGLISLPLGIENGAAIEDRVEDLTHFHKRGVRYITLTHSKDNLICDSSYDKTRTHQGLSEFGKKVVAEMNRLGIMIDISHVSDDAFFQVIELTKVPVIASHSSARHFTPGFERNMNDEMIKALAKNGGVMMVNFGSSFISERVNKYYSLRYEKIMGFAKKNGLERKSHEVQVFQNKYDTDNPVKLATVEEVADHIEHVIKLVGVEHVGFGSDFDGVGESLPEGLKDVSAYPNLIRVLLERGYSEEDVEKIASGNVLRVWSAVESHAAAVSAAEAVNDASLELSLRKIVTL